VIEPLRCGQTAAAVPHTGATMPLLLEIVVVLVVLAVVVLLFGSIKRMMGPGGRGRGVGVGSVMTDLDAMLQPHHPNAEVLEKAKQGEEEHDDEGDGKDPGRRR
jgi:membrane protein involved in colicin uptake